jgi:hypothetical protein
LRRGRGAGRVHRRWRGACWHRGEATWPPEALLIGREFAHLDRAPDHSLPAMLPAETVTAAVAAGWAEPHPVALRGLIPADAGKLGLDTLSQSEAAITDKWGRASRCCASA